MKKKKEDVLYYFGEWYGCIWCKWHWGAETICVDLKKLDRKCSAFFMIPQYTVKKFLQFLIQILVLAAGIYLLGVTLKEKKLSVLKATMTG